MLTGIKDGTLRIWDAVNGKELIRLDGHEQDIAEARWCADESKILRLVMMEEQYASGMPLLARRLIERLWHLNDNILNEQIYLLSHDKPLTIQFDYKLDAFPSLCQITVVYHGLQVVTKIVRW